MAALASPAPDEGSIEVLVSWSTLEPAADIGVHAKFRAPGSSRSQLRFARTDELGRARFEYPGNLPAGETPVVVTAPGYPTWSAEVEITPGGARDLEVQLVPGARIAGRVLTRDGVPVVGGKILIAEEFKGGWFHHQVPPPRTTTDEQGRFLLEGVAPGTRELNATPVWADRSLGKAKWRFECASGEQLSAELVLDPGLVIEGRVVDADGIGVAGWMARSETLDWTQYEGGMSKSYPRSGRTDSHGHFLLANLGAGRHDLKLSPSGFYGSALARVSAVVAGTVGIEVVVDRDLVPDASISGTLETLPSNAWVTVGKRGEKEAFFIDVDEASGRFEYGPLVAGNYQIMVSQNQVSLYAGELLELKRGEHRELGLIRFHEPGTVELRLYGDLPKDLGNMMISASREGCPSSELRMEEGRFFAYSLAEGRWKLSLWQEPYFMADQWVEVQSGVTTRVDATLRMGFERQLSCRFASADVAWQQLDVEVHDEMAY